MIGKEMILQKIWWSYRGSIRREQRTRLISKKNIQKGKMNCPKRSFRKFENLFSHNSSRTGIGQRTELISKI